MSPGIFSIESVAHARTVYVPGSSNVTVASKTAEVRPSPSRLVDLLAAAVVAPSRRRGTFGPFLLQGTLIPTRIKDCIGRPTVNHPNQ